jgi:hypothetical protein
METGEWYTTDWENELQATTEKRNQAIAAREQLLSEKRGFLLVLNDEKYSRKFELLDLQRKQERDISLLALVNKFLVVPSFENLSLEFAEHLYFVLAFQYRYEHIRNILTKVQQSTEFPWSDRLKLLGLLQEHYEFHGSHHQELVTTVQETLRQIEKSEDFGTDWVDVLNFNMREQLESLLDIDRQSGKFMQPRNENSSDLRAVDLGVGAGIDGAVRNKVPLTWGQISTIQDAVEELNKEIVVMSGESQPALTALRNFFVSPDVAPTFEHIRNISKPDFLALVNSFLIKKLSLSVIEAFLIYCHQAGDLFILTITDKVSAYAQGWEVVAEMPIRGPARRVK